MKCPLIESAQISFVRISRAALTFFFLLCTDIASVSQPAQFSIDRPAENLTEFSKFERVLRENLGDIDKKNIKYLDFEDEHGKVYIFRFDEGKMCHYDECITVMIKEGGSGFVSATVFAGPTFQMFTNYYFFNGYRVSTFQLISRRITYTIHVFPTTYIINAEPTSKN